MSNERLLGLCVMTAHREKNSKNKQGFIERVVYRFERDLRHLQLLFLRDADKCCWTK